MKRVENAVGARMTHLSGIAMAAVPLLVAAGFAMAAGVYWANEELGPLFGNLAVAGVFLVISALAYAYARRREEQREARVREELEAMAQASPMAAILRALQSPNVSGALVDMAKTAAPKAAASVLRSAPRNLPLLVGAGVGLMVASRLVEAWTNGRRH
ncbi:MAG: hypothetical protein ACR652_18970 [Methylocystis sp.]|uniref:hypothetical protein n=2 Tax=Methylocystis sp. TaxID=1911079 RepID=UPI003DA5C74A